MISVLLQECNGSEAVPLGKFDIKLILLLKFQQVPDILTRREQQVVQVPETIVPKEPPPEYEFVADPPSISAFDL